MIHRFVSMNINYVELTNYVQTIPYDNKIQTYNIYREMIPKKKVFLKYIKSKIPIKIHKVKTGEKIFDWNVPKEWNIKDAYVKDSRGKK